MNPGANFSTKSTSYGGYDYAYDYKYGGETGPETRAPAAKAPGKAR